VNKQYVVAVCGASGSIYAVRFLKAFLQKAVTVHLIFSDAGRQVAAHELGSRPDACREGTVRWLEALGVEVHPEARLLCWRQDDLFAPPASGSFRHDGMVIVPCSMKTLGAIAAGIPQNLIHRAADVSLKERRPLILLTRESPLHPIHLHNMQQAALAGATVMPASPGFYHHPRSVEELVDGMVARILDHLGIAQTLVAPWGGNGIV
jgi:4-hydroxy-3-polyprenylbenzoate decarboxylase